MVKRKKVNVFNAIRKYANYGLPFSWKNNGIKPGEENEVLFVVNMKKIETLSASLLI